MIIKKYYDYINESGNKLILSAGIAILYQDMLFVVHGTDLGPNYWTIPKGEIDKDENILEGALRELKEETGIILDPKLFKNQEPLYVEYLANRGLKRLYYFTIRINDLSEIGLDSLTIPSSKLEWEIDEAKFMKEDKVRKIYKREIISMLNNIFKY